jgi:hypothetical protein
MSYVFVPLLAVLLVPLLAAPEGPSRPDFTGTWRANLAKSRLEIPAPESTTFRLEHREGELRLSRTHVSQGNSDTWGIELTIGGPEVESVSGDRKLRCRMAWDGDVLVFDVRIGSGDDEARNVVRYQMANDGRSFTADERYTSGAHSHHNVWVLDRVE